MHYLTIIFGISFTSCKSIDKSNERRIIIVTKDKSPPEVDFEDDSGADAHVDNNPIKEDPSEEAPPKEEIAAEKEPPTLNCDPVTLACLKYQKLKGQPKGANFYNDMDKYGTKITQEIQNCNWATLPQIYVFPDGLVYSAINRDTYNYFTSDVVHIYGCHIPDYVNPYTTSQQLTYPGDGTSLANLGYETEVEERRMQPSTFAQDVKKAKKITQAEHNCAFAKRTLIYIFPDGVLYASPSRTDYRFYKRETVISRGCTL